jgi:cyclophilin family peptidyl-prolyl cis-trans isomerase
MKPSTLAALIIVLLIPVIALMFTQKDTSSTPTPETSPTPTAQTVTKAADLIDPADAISAKKVILKTEKGDITINLFPEDAPKTVKNFVTLGKRGYYDNVSFHRIVKDFVAQAGDPTGSGSGGSSIYGPTFPDEINNHKIVKGSVAMANAGPNTNSSQFFIVTKVAQPTLDGGYTCFGEIDPASQSVVDALNDLGTSSGTPSQKVKITGFQIVE